MHSTVKATTIFRIKRQKHKVNNKYKIIHYLKNIYSNMLWLQHHASAVLFSTFGISVVVMIVCLGLFLYYVLVSFKDGLSAHPKYVTECSIMIVGYFSIANAMTIFRLFGQNPISFVFHAITALAVTLFVLLQMGLIFNIKGWKLFYYTFPLPASIMTACFLAECIYALYKAVCTPGAVKPLSQVLHTGVHAFLGVTTFVIMFWNVTLVLAMMCVNPKHQQSISEIKYEDLLVEPGYMALLVLLYMLLILFILLIPFLKSKKSAQHVKYDKQEIKNETRSKNNNVSTESTQTETRKETLDDEEEDTREYDEDGADGDDEDEERDNVTKTNRRRKFRIGHQGSRTKK